MIKNSGKVWGLKNYINSVQIIDTDPLSKHYFRISEFPDRLGLGKNLVKLNANDQTLAPGSDIYIEFIDSNGNTLYHEIVDYVDSDKSRILAVYVYDDTPIGEFQAYIAGRSTWDNVTGKKIPYSNSSEDRNYLNNPNLIWYGTGIITPDRITDSRLFFVKEPTIRFTEITRNLKETPQASRFSSSVFSQYATLKIDSTSVPLQFANSLENKTTYKTDNTTENSPTLVGSVGNYTGKLSVPSVGGMTTVTLETRLSVDRKFTDAMVGGIITFNNININNDIPKDATNLSDFQNIPAYSASIVNVINNAQIEIYPPFVFSTSYRTSTGKRQISIKKFTCYGPSGSIGYYAWPPLSNTLVTQSFLQAEIKNLEPAVGYLDAINVSYKPFGSVGEFIDYGTITTQQQNLFIYTSSLSLTSVDGVKEASVGQFLNQTNINAIWRGLTSFTSPNPTLTATSSNILFGMHVSQSAIPDSLNYVLIRAEDQYNIAAISNTEYTLTFNTYCEHDSLVFAEPQLDVYISGSQIYREDITVKKKYLPKLSTFNLGEYIGPIVGSDRKIIKNKFDFIVKSGRKIIPRFVIRSGKWTISNVQLGPRYYPGYSPNYYRLLLPVDRIKKNTEYVFKFEYLDKLGQRANTNSKLYGIKFIGSAPEINLTDTPLILSSGSVNYTTHSIPMYDVANQKLINDHFIQAQDISATPQLFVNYGGKPITSKAVMAVMGFAQTDPDPHFEVTRNTDGNPLFAVSGSTIYIPNIAASSGGSALQITNQGRVYFVVSDENLKTEITNLPDNILNKILNIRPVSYKFIDGDKKEIGLLAQNIEQEFPEFVHEMPGGKTVDYAKLTAILIKAIQELYQKIIK